MQYEGLDEARAVGQGVVYARAFEHGLVMVNPSTETVTLDVAPDARRLTLTGGTLAADGAASWDPLDAPLTLAPHTASILLHSR